MVLYLSGLGKFISLNRNICLEQFMGFNIFPLADVTFWQVWNNFWMICSDLVSRLQWSVISLHLSCFSISCRLASKSKDFPQPYLPTMITFWFDRSQDCTIYTSFIIYLVIYMCWTSSESLSLYSVIFPLLMVRHKGSLLPGTGLP